MSSDIFNFIQTQIQTQTQAQVKGSSQNVNNDSASQPGLFDSLMTEYANINLDSEQQTNLELLDTQQVIMSSGNNSMPQSVIDILAGLRSEASRVFSLSNMPENQQETLSFYAYQSQHL